MPIVSIYPLPALPILGSGRPQGRTGRVEQMEPRRLVGAGLELPRAGGVCRQAEVWPWSSGSQSHFVSWKSVLESDIPITIPGFQNSIILHHFWKLFIELFLWNLFWEEREASSKIYHDPSVSLVTGCHPMFFSLVFFHWLIF